MTEISFKTAVMKLKFERMVKALADRPSTAASLAERMFYSKSATNQIIRFGMNLEPRQVRIADWLRCRRGFTPIYGLGSAPDKPMPRKLTAKEFRAKVAKDPKRLAQRQATTAEMRRRNRLARVPTLYEDVLSQLSFIGHCRIQEIADRLKIGNPTVASALRDLEVEKKVMRIMRPGQRWALWALYSEAWVKQEREVPCSDWTPKGLQKQSIFSALGL
jgi:hypothetical protein